MSNLVSHAERELALAGMGPEAEDSMDRLMGQQILDIVKLFSTHQHSGSSAVYAINLISPLLKFEPIQSLTGNDDEWEDVSAFGEPLWQNKRCSRVFKRADGTCFDVEGIIFTDKNGDSWTNRKSHVDVEFPYIPTTKRVCYRWWKFWLR